jgi:2-polyprenyl-3-methyl-5-hydroxy-6-metoxy-1,4-benzoquinol methylase
MQIFGSAGFPKIGRIDYSDYWRDRGFTVNKKLKEREEIMLTLVPKGAHVLDIGCGNSRLPLSLKEKGCIVEVGDVSPIVLDAFKKEGIGASVIDLDKPHEAQIGNYDIIIMSEVLEHMANPEEIIASLKAKTDYFLLTIPNSGFYPFRLRLFFGGRALKQWVHHPSEHVRFWSHKDFLEWLSVQGLTVERSIPSNGLTMKGFLPFLKDMWPNLLGHQIVYLCRAKM